MTTVTLNEQQYDELKLLIEEVVANQLAIYGTLESVKSSVEDAVVRLEAIEANTHKGKEK